MDVRTNRTNRLRRPATTGTDASALLRLLAGAWLAPAVHVVAKLAIADRLAARSQTAAELASGTGTNPDALRRLLRALVAAGVFGEDDAGRLHLTPLSACLRGDVPDTLRAFAVMIGEPAHWRAWEGLLHSVQTGRPAFDQVFGMSHFEYFLRHPDAGAIFDAAMTSRSGPENRALCEAWAFGEDTTIVDVGGGLGSLLLALLDRLPRAHGMLFDQPRLANTALRRIAAAGLSTRCTFVGGDFFSGVPTGGDVYIVKKVIHDWDDARARTILAQCRAAMAPSSRLLVVEPIVPAGTGPSFNKLLDLLMLAWTAGGRERTEPELAALLHDAGLDVEQVVPTAAGVGVVVARPVGA